jgi:hypothetical protein
MIADSLQVIHVIFLSILFGLLLCFAILFLLSFRTIICKLNVLFKHFVDAELLQNICAFGVCGS